MSDEDYSKFISEKLFTKVKPVIFTDLINEFKCGPNKAKSQMYSYYKNTSNVKFQCVLVACYSNDKIKIINDVNNIENQDKMTDCFIYAFNPMDVFNPVNDALVRMDDLLIKNPNKISIESNSINKAPELTRTKTVDNEIKPKKVLDEIKRSNTLPEANYKIKKEEHIKEKKQESKLRPTELLAKMRQEREQKEKDRQEELKKRKDEQAQQKMKSDPKAAAQIKELNDIFANDDMSDYVDEDDKNMAKATIDDDITQSSPQNTNKIQQSTINPSDLEEILDTTGEESLLMFSQNEKKQAPAKGKTEHNTNKEEEEVTTYLDEDGYMVTKKSTNKCEPIAKAESRKRSSPIASSLKSSVKKVKMAPAKRKQGSLDFFFKKNK
ncbi:similar to Saccharomyces cerevisiae YJR043C POL32 Third subunit of DNA polymerase delta, involved in chromosomal DNA replication [Maudiozyma barnettii]|uniref:Similar to Saccharomyces cerevisiae YJR043C POL32 Third subunit of DNA polymerase delta, involved in chromosomal DNA replication n=1 Tax=Maudiozyma barnettii TaxID=61262 RepID=A0A8H2VFJ9_9SACH|nr:DNA polymerase delta subunit POL32 [Kazachstania barnettii]CAB4254666.1 similar to Saccharomyces cerevisiae YJR043C POL32 Third subunit of DNA polymerase delta, involved in chromosomal DNA replication [Kazachstania barnettii]CAD1782708.1 similar to Saccharomyces cerevisiae YJR043C POL32 Third subunit of DNA polymerase delta, involved in chromosomal DNA replication [Kazachstania barnettii]